METQRIKFESGKQNYYASELGIWSDKSRFIPLKAIQYLKVIDHDDSRLHIAYSSRFDWAYVNNEEDELAQFLDKLVENKTVYRVAEGQRIEGSSVKYMTLENDLKLEYSYQGSLLIIFKNKRKDNIVKNKLWIAEWLIDRNFKATGTEEYQLSESEISKLQDSSTSKLYGQFNYNDKQETYLDIDSINTKSNNLQLIIIVIVIISILLYLYLPDPDANW